MEKMRPGLGALCASIAGVAVLSTHPVAEMGFQDDWSYIRTALEYSRSGRFVYNGWATAMLGWMIPWGALFIRVFGFSFTVLRLSTLPIAMATAALLYASFRRLSLSASNAVFGSLTIVLSPIFLPMAASYMTDVPGMLSIVLCLYLCLRAAAARSERASILWLCCAATSNVVGGTARQISWLGALVMVPSTAFLLHRQGRKLVLAAAGLLWLSSAASILLALHWWNRQPYSVPEHINRGHITLTMAHHFGGKIVKGFLCLLLLVYPVLSGWIGQVRYLGRAALLRVGAAVGLATICLLSLSEGARELWTLPWIGHLLYSVLWGRGEFPGDAPAVLSLPDRTAITLLVIATGAICFEAIWALKRSGGGAGTAGLSLPQTVLWILLPFSTAYLALLLPRTLYEFLYDRYFIGIMPIMITVLLLWYQRRVAARMPAIAFAVLTLISIFTIAGTHDWFATNRARIAAVNEVSASGVPKTSIQAGFEYDGWTEIDVTGYVNDRRIVVPRGAYRLTKDQSGLPERCLHFFGAFTPEIHPVYLLSSSMMSCFDRSTYAPVAYKAWLPPFVRHIYIEKSRGSTLKEGP